MDKLTKLCKLYQEKSVSLALQQTNPELFEALSDAKFTCNEMKKLRTIKNNEKEFSYLINKAAQVLPLLVTYARHSMNVDKATILEYKNVRDQANALLEKFMEYSRPPVDEDQLDELNLLFWQFCGEFGNFIDKLELYSS